MKKGERFTVGDYIEVVADGRVVRGAALDTRDTLGHAYFSVQDEVGTVYDFNLNHVEVRLVFNADVARGTIPVENKSEPGAIPAVRDGVWVVVFGNYGDDEIASVHPSEIDALRKVNEDGYGRARFIPWATRLYDIPKDWDEK